MLFKPEHAKELPRELVKNKNLIQSVWGGAGGLLFLIRPPVSSHAGSPGITPEEAQLLGFGLWPPGLWT